MIYLKSFKKRFVLFLLILIMTIYACYLFTLLSLPGQITILKGQEHLFNFKNPFFVNIRPDRDDVLSINDMKISMEGNILSLYNPISFKTDGGGRVNLSMKLFGILPLKTLRVDILTNRQIAACGNTVGVKLKTDGVLVIGMSDVVTKGNNKVLPARDSSIRPGDTILQINNQKVNGISDLVKEIESSQGKAVTLKYKRAGKVEETKIIPVKAVDDDKYHVGLWVRDSTAGIGTLTFYDPSSGYFGALGHGITDIDTGILMPIKSGELVASDILAVKKSERGSPGELKGVFAEEKKLGTISINSEFGIYGELNDDAQKSISSTLYPIAVRCDVEEGPAYILSNVEGSTVEKYSVEIERVSRHNVNGLKDMVVRVTDERLINATGGIVQGMSGSPIIQNGRIIGAVTHVLVNDPTRGYGIFIESMLKNIDRNNTVNINTAFAG